MIAMALVHNPSVLIADEPTTALDVTVQAQILELIERVKREFDIGVILITHDLGVIAETADTVLVMYAGRAMEYGPAREIFAAPQHPYTWGLLRSMPTIELRLDEPRRHRGHTAVARRRARRVSLQPAVSVRASRPCVTELPELRAVARRAISTAATSRPSRRERRGQRRPAERLGAAR